MSILSLANRELIDWGAEGGRGLPGCWLKSNSIKLEAISVSKVHLEGGRSPLKCGRGEGRGESERERPTLGKGPLPSSYLILSEMCGFFPPPPPAIPSWGRGSLLASPRATKPVELPPLLSLPLLEFADLKRKWPISPPPHPWEENPEAEGRGGEEGRLPDPGNASDHLRGGRRGKAGGGGRAQISFSSFGGEISRLAEEDNSWVAGASAAGPPALHFRALSSNWTMPADRCPEPSFSAPIPRLSPLAWLLGRKATQASSMGLGLFLPLHLAGWPKPHGLQTLGGGGGSGRHALQRVPAQSWTSKAGLPSWNQSCRLRLAETLQGNGPAQQRTFNWKRWGLDLLYHWAMVPACEKLPYFK